MAAQATIVSVISAGAHHHVALVAQDSSNVSAVIPDDAPVSAATVADLWKEVHRRPPVYSLAPFDPFVALVDAWAARLSGGRDDLEIAIGLVPDLDPPDFYLVDEGLEDPHKAWYFELLFSEAPRRVVAYDGTPRSIVRALRDLGFGPPVPPGRRLAELARSFVPGTRVLGTT
jgi:hypothetical protein